MVLFSDLDKDPNPAFSPWSLAHGCHLDLSGKPLVMGIINVTPDSFYDGGKYCCCEMAVCLGLQMAHAGADILDVGGESTRPGAQAVTASEEMARILPVIGSLAKQVGIPISVDTYKAPVALAAVEAGACIINDIGGLRLDPQMAQVAAKTGAGLVLMHSRATPKEMQQHTHYEDMVGEIAATLVKATQQAVAAGVDTRAIVLDPGIGFGKKAAQNLEILANLGRLINEVNRPLLLGVSRKSFLGAVSGLPPDHRLMGTAAAVTAAVLGGSHVVRVHDVAQMREVVDVAWAIRQQGRMVE